MFMPIRTVIVATAMDSLRNMLLRMLSQRGLFLNALLQDGRTVHSELAVIQPDLVVLDAYLPGMEGAAVAQHILARADLPVRPRVMLIKAGEYPLYNAEALAGMGAVILETPFLQDDFDDAVHRLEHMQPCFLPRQQARVEQLLDELGVPQHPGRDCLKYAVLIAGIDARVFRRLRSVLYNQVGEICGMRQEQVERAMRYAISAAWSSDKFENQYRIFADTIDASRGEPTLSEMIARLADILRMEG